MFLSFVFLLCCIVLAIAGTALMCASGGWIFLWWVTYPHLPMNRHSFHRLVRWFVAGALLCTLGVIGGVK